MKQNKDLEFQAWFLFKIIIFHIIQIYKWKIIKIISNHTT